MRPFSNQCPIIGFFQFEFFSLLGRNLGVVKYVQKNEIFFVPQIVKTFHF